MFHMCYLAFHVPSCAEPLTSTLSEHFTRPADEVPQICAFKARNRSRAFRPTSKSIPPDLVSIPPDEQEHSTRLGEHFARPAEHSTRHSAVRMFA
jgi:hypothetical protein